MPENKIALKIDQVTGGIDIVATATDRDGDEKDFTIELRGTLADVLGSFIKRLQYK